MSSVSEVTELQELLEVIDQLPDTVKLVVVLQYWCNAYKAACLSAPTISQSMSFTPR